MNTTTLPQPISLPDRDAVQERIRYHRRELRRMNILLQLIAAERSRNKAPAKK